MLTLAVFGTLNNTSYLTNPKWLKTNEREKSCIWDPGAYRRAAQLGHCVGICCRRTDVCQRAGAPGKAHDQQDEVCFDGYTVFLLEVDGVGSPYIGFAKVVAGSFLLGILVMLRRDAVFGRHDVRVE